MTLKDYSKREEMVPCRDGIRLYTAIYSPDDQNKHPILLMRTPYALRPYGKGYAKNLRSYMRNYIQAGYIIVYQNVRGTYLSEGVFENIRPLGEVDEATDTYDTIDWLLSHAACDGNVGVTGNSYAGFYAVMAALSGHPAIKAVCPQAPVTDWYMGDDAHRNGIFMLLGMYGFGGSFFRARKKPGIRSLTSSFKVEDGAELRDLFLGKGLGEILSPVRKNKSFWADLISHPDYDEFWKDRCPLRHLTGQLPAIMVVGGTFDAEDCYGSLNTYKAIRAQAPKAELYFTLGPWAHGAWRSRDYEGLCPKRETDEVSCGDDERKSMGVYFGKGLGDYYLDEIERPFFAYYLEGKGEKPKPPVRLLPSAETMVQGRPMEWVALPFWPPKASRRLRFSLCGTHLKEGSDGSIEYDGKPRSYISDPSDPVPFQEEELNFWPRDYMAADQSFLDRRKDVLSYESEAVKEPLMVFGPVRVILNVSTSTEDADLIVKLIDVRPDGYKMLIRMDAIPLRYRKGCEVAVPMVPCLRERVELKMNDIAHILMQGHRLMVQVQSSFFPLMAMNPQRLVPNIYEATAADFTPCEVTIHCSSYIELPII